MTLKERFLLTLILGFILTLTYWLLLGFLFVVGVDEISLGDFIKAAYIYFGGSFLFVLILYPIISWFIKKINKMK